MIFWCVGGMQLMVRFNSHSTKMSAKKILFQFFPICFSFIYAGSSQWKQEKQRNNNNQLQLISRFESEFRGSMIEIFNRS